MHGPISMVYLAYIRILVLVEEGNVLWFSPYPSCKYRGIFSLHFLSPTSLAK